METLVRFFCEGMDYLTVVALFLAAMYFTEKICDAYHVNKKAAIVIRFAVGVAMILAIGMATNSVIEPLKELVSEAKNLGDDEVDEMGEEAERHIRAAGL